MRLLLIRHGDPDYEKDGLTAVGRREAELLAERIAPMDVAAYYVSTMGRASETARYTLEKAGGGPVRLAAGVFRRRPPAGLRGPQPCPLGLAAAGLVKGPDPVGPGALARAPRFR